MTIYVLSNVRLKEYEYVEFLIKSCGYNNVEAETRYWEIEYQINQRCNPILIKPNSSGTLKFKSVLQKQEIARLANNSSQLMRIINRRNGTWSNTQWNVDYIVSNNGDVFITSIQCHNMHSENTIHQYQQQIINEDIQNDSEKHMKGKTILPLTESHIRHIVRETLRRYLQL